MYLFSEDLTVVVQNPMLSRAEGVCLMNILYYGLCALNVMLQVARLLFMLLRDGNAGSNLTMDCKYNTI